MASSELTNKLQTILKEDCGIELSFEEAGDCLAAWTKYFDILLTESNKQKGESHENSD